MMRVVPRPALHQADQRAERHQHRGGDNRPALSPGPRLFRRRRRCRREGGDEPVALARHRLDESRRPGIVAERQPQLAEAVVQAAVVVDVRVLGPDRTAERVAWDQLPGVGNQPGEHQCRLPFECDRDAVPPEFAGGQVEGEAVEPAPGGIAHTLAWTSR